MQLFTLTLTTLLLSSLASGQAITMGGHHDPFLAGQPAGTTTKGDVAPDQAPFLVAAPVSSGAKARFFDVSGDVNNIPGGGGPGPEGPVAGSVFCPTSLGISGYDMPANALLGVFLPDDVNSGVAPANLDFSSPTSRDFATLTPALFQIFFIGDGLRADGLTVQEFIAPAGATRLYLGSCDGFGWYNNSGSYTLAVELTPAVASYCTAGTSAAGCQAVLSASGVPSATAATGFTLQASGVEGAKDGLFFFGANGRQANPWGNGSSFQCVVPPVKRAGLLSAAGTSAACDGAFDQDLNTRWSTYPAQNPGAGAVVQAQLWYRDPLNTSNQTTSLSDALEFTTGP